MAVVGLVVFVGEDADEAGLAAHAPPIITGTAVALDF